MAGIGAIFDIGEAATRLLKGRLKLRAGPAGLPSALQIKHLSVGEFSKLPDTEEALTLICYRVLPSGHAAPQPQTRGSQRPSRLGVDLHYLLSAWSPNAETEQLMLAWAMLELHKHAIFNRALLALGGANWGRDETVHFVAEPIAHEAMFRIWDSLQPKYRLSAAYCARVVHIEDGIEEDHAPVVETNLGFASADPVEAEALA
jgi:Pvc16 N-terminal domain